MITMLESSSLSIASLKSADSYVIVAGVCFMIATTKANLFHITSTDPIHLVLGALAERQCVYTYTYIYTSARIVRK